MESSSARAAGRPSIWNGSRQPGSSGSAEVARPPRSTPGCAPDARRAASRRTDRPSAMSDSPAPASCIVARDDADPRRRRSARASSAVTLRTSSADATSTAQASATSVTTSDPVPAPSARAGRGRACRPSALRPPAFARARAPAAGRTGWRWQRRCTSANASSRRSIVVVRQPRHLDRHRRRWPALSSASAPTRAGERAGRREQQALDQHLTHQPPARRAERGAHGDLSRASGGPRQQQARDVQTGRDQQERDRAEQHEQRRPVVAEHVVEQRHRSRDPSAVGRRVLRRRAVR